MNIFSQCNNLIKLLKDFLLLQNGKNKKLIKMLMLAQANIIQKIEHKLYHKTLIIWFLEIILVKKKTLKQK